MNTKSNATNLKDNLQNAQPLPEAEREFISEDAKLHVSGLLFAIVPSTTTVAQLEEIALETYGKVLDLWVRYDKENR